MAPVIKLNEDTLDIDLSGMTKLSDIAEKIAEDYFGPKEIVIELYINEKLMEEGSIVSVGETAISEMKSVSFVTIKNPAEQVVVLLKKMSDYMEGFSQGVEKVADQFRVGSPEEANLALMQAIEGITAFLELLATVKMVSQSELDHLNFEDKSLKDRESELLEVTKNMQASQEEKDWITVADLLEYELAPLMNGWKGMIPLLEKEVLGST